MKPLSLKVRSAGPYMSVQDQGRPGYLRFGVSPGGAMDLPALAHGQVLLGNGKDCAAIEMLGPGGRFAAVGGRVHGALTGAWFSASIEGKAVDPHTVFSLQPGQELVIAAAGNGNYGYLSIAGGFDTKPVLGSRSTHIRAGFGGFKGRRLQQGDELPIGIAADPLKIHYLPAMDRPIRDELRILWSAQAQLFSARELQRFIETSFKVTHELDRMGARLTSEANPIRSNEGLGAVSDAIALGDIQVPGNGRPIVLLKDRQPTGGYPRIATIIGADIAAFAQLTAGTELRFVPVSENEAVEALGEMQRQMVSLPARLVEHCADPYESHRLLSQNLISGVVSSHDQKKGDVKS